MTRALRPVRAQTDPPITFAWRWETLTDEQRARVTALLSGFMATRAGERARWAAVCAMYPAARGRGARP